MASTRERALIEDLSLALVREYLAKKKYKTTLETLQSELPVKPVPTTTTVLAKNLGITKFVTSNSQAERPYATLLEIFAEFMYQTYGKEGGASDATSKSSTASASKVSSSASVEKSTSKSSSKSRTYDDDDDDEQLSRAMSKASVTRASSFIPSTASTTSSRSSTASSLGKPSSPSSPGSISSPVSSSSSSRPSDRSSRDRDRDRDDDRGRSRESESASVIGSLSFGAARPGSASRGSRGASPPKSSNSKSSSTSASSKVSKHDDLMMEEDIDFDEEVESFDARSTSFTKPGASALSGGNSRGGDSGKSDSGSSSSSFPTTPVPSATPMSLEAAHRVKSLIFGSSHLTGTFTDPWLLQGFYFKPDEVTREVPSLACGLVQAQGGPCGMLAVVQAYVIKELLYTGSNERATPSARYDLMTNCKPDQLKRALINAWVEILWMVGDSRLVRACVKNPSAAKMSGARKMANGSTFKPDGITEALSYVELTSKDSVRNFFTVHHSVYADKKGAGCVLFLYSVILTRGVENVEKDRDEASSLIGAHSYCIAVGTSISMPNGTSRRIEELVPGDVVSSFSLSASVQAADSSQPVEIVLPRATHQCSAADSEQVLNGALETAAMEQEARVQKLADQADQDDEDDEDDESSVTDVGDVAKPDMEDAGEASLSVLPAVAYSTTAFVPSSRVAPSGTLPASAGLIDRAVSIVHSRGKKQCLELTFLDGRKLVCTPDHRLLTTNGWVEAQHLTCDSEVAWGSQPPLFPADEDAVNSDAWSLDLTETLGYVLDLKGARDRALAFARLLGYILTDGTLTAGGAVSLFAGHELDVASLKRDVAQLTGATPAVQLLHNTFAIRVPSSLGRAFLHVGLAPGKRGMENRSFPQMVLSPTCPVPILRSFLSGVFGGDGITFSLSAQGQLSGLGWCVSSKGDVAKAQFQTTTTEMNAMLARCGIRGAALHWTARTGTSDKSKGEKQKRLKRKQLGQAVTEAVDWETADPAASVQLRLHINKGGFVPFAMMIGFAHCCHKQARLDVAIAVFRTHDFVFSQREAIRDAFQEIPESSGNYSARVELAKEVVQQKQRLHPSVLKWKPVNNAATKEGMRNKNQPPRGVGLSVTELLQNYCGGTEEVFGKPTDNKVYTAKRRLLQIAAASTSGAVGLPVWKMRLADIRSVIEPMDTYDITVGGAPDDEASFVANGSVVHNCTQEMVNLALTGRARSNVFNGTKDLGGLILRGIDQRASIGFLSLFEHYENIEVGSYLKQPAYPIWVICSESHYTVAWCLDSEATTRIPGNGVFDLHYYDELANQKEEIKLTIDTTQKGMPHKDGDLEPPINECIRTKWGKNARVDWNGVEPIL